MWNFFRSKPACPIEPEPRHWADARFAWLSEQFGADTPARVRVILPTPEFFPDEYAGRDEDVEPMARRIAGYMGVDAERLEVFVYADAARAVAARDGLQQAAGTAGLYLHGEPGEPGGRVLIGVEEAQLTDLVSLVATLAHEIAHEPLLGQGRIGADQPDHEPLTDLLTVFLGLGVFTANATVRDRGWSDGAWAGWQTSRHGYLDQRTLGYALALFARRRGPAADSAWIKHVRPDVRSPLRAALKFLDAER